MTRKDYVKLAGVIVDSMLDTNSKVLFEGVEIVYERLINCLQEENPRFNEEKFRAYISKNLREGVK